MVAYRIGRLKHLIWNGYHSAAHDELFGMRHMASEVAYLNGEKFRPPVARLLWNCNNLRRYLANNAGSLIDYGERYRGRSRWVPDWLLSAALWPMRSKVSVQDVGVPANNGLKMIDPACNVI